MSKVNQIKGIKMVQGKGKCASYEWKVILRYD